MNAAIQGLIEECAAHGEVTALERQTHRFFQDGAFAFKPLQP
jgi:hypothetical protein